MATSAFAKAFANKAGKVLSKAKGRKHRTGKSFGPADVPDGSYTALITTETSVPSKGKFEGVPIVSFICSINSGSHEGKEPKKDFWCEGKPPIPEGSDDIPTAEQQLFALMQFLLPDYDLSEIDETQIEEVLSIINERKIVALIGIKNGVSKANKPYQTVYINKVVSSSETSSEEDDAQDPEEIVDASDTESEDDSEGLSDYVPRKGDPVSVEDQPGAWEVVKCYQATNKVDVKNSKDHKLGGIPWSDLTFLGE